MERYTITKQAVKDLVARVVRKMGVVRLLPLKKGFLSRSSRDELRIWVRFRGYNQVDIRMDVEVRNGEKLPETMDKISQSVRSELKKICALELREIKITVRGLYEEELSE
jgi:uncharacterized alkaline shock family protein YloU